MGDYQSVFKRYEKKYLINAEKRKVLLDMVNTNLEKDKYYKCTILSIYYDTPSDFIIRNSLDKPMYKEKLRLRSYGIPDKEDTVFLEIKKKYDGIVYKRRTSIPLCEVEKFFDGTKNPESQIERELLWTIKHYKNISPAMYVSYDRTSFCGTYNSDFRVTFDTNILYRDTALTLADGIWGEQLLEGDMYIMEVKSPYAIPLWFSHSLEQLKIYPSSFSKYGSAYQLCKAGKNSAENKDKGGEKRELAFA